MNKLLILIVAALAASPALAATDIDALAKAKNCFACHQTDTKLVGPPYKEVAKKYAGDKTAAAKLTEKVVKGGVGVWGPVPMPPNPIVSPAEAKTLVDWVLSLK